MYCTIKRYTWKRRMRTNIDIDDALLSAAQKATGLKTKKATVEEGLRLLVRMKAQRDVADLFGKYKWEGDLERSRRSRFVR